MNDARTGPVGLLRRVARRTRGELTVLATLLVLTAALLAFATIAENVVAGDTETFDRTVLLALREPDDPSDPIGPPWLETVARDMTSLGSLTVLAAVSLAVAGYLLTVRRPRIALLVLAAVGSGMAVSSLLKHLFGRLRPDLVPHGVQVATSSFPSGHAMLSAVTWLTLGALLVRVHRRRSTRAYLFGVAVLLALAIGASRVYLGVHWPTDVLAGWCVGAAWAMLWWIVAALGERRARPR